jgi:hypothetical protein
VPASPTPSCGSLEIGQTAERTMTPAGRRMFKSTLSATPACPGGQTGTSRARRSVAREGTARRARGPPVRYRDKPDPKPQTLKPGGKLLDACGAIKERGTALPLRTRNRQQTKKPLDRKTPIQVSNEPGRSDDIIEQLKAVKRLILLARLSDLIDPHKATGPHIRK